MTLERFFNRCGHYRVLSAIKTRNVYFDELKEETVFWKKIHKQMKLCGGWIVERWTMNNEHMLCCDVSSRLIVTENKWSGVMFPLKFLLLILCEVYFIWIIRRRRTECHMCEYNIFRFNITFNFFCFIFWFCSLLLVCGNVCILYVCCTPINVI